MRGGSLLRLSVLFSLLLALAAVGCGDDDDTGRGSDPGGTGVGEGGAGGDGGGGGALDPGAGGDGGFGGGEAPGGQGGEGGGATEQTPTSLEITSPWTELVVGDSATLSVRVFDQVGVEIEAPELSFHSTAPEVATVDPASGLVRGRGPGSTRIEITSGPVTVELELEVYFRFSEFTGGHHQSCALTLSGEAWCWGSNERGFLGDGGEGSFSVPVRVAADVEFTQILGTEGQICALAKDAEIWCWGTNSDGATFGPDHTEVEQSNVPVPLGVKSYGFTSIAGGNGFVCALDGDGTAWCWGRNTEFHELGIPSTEPTPTPTQVAPPEGGSALTFRLLRSGEHPTCGITTDDEIYCWGHNHQGEAGIGTGADHAPVPTPIMPGVKVKDVYFGVQHACAITADDGTYCWGDNRNGAVGTGTIGGAVRSPTQITPTEATFTSFGMGWSFTIGIDQNGEAWSWGIASDQILARDTDGLPTATPGKIDSALRWVRLHANNNHVCGMATDGLLYCWGSNGHGRLGTNSIAESSGVPTPVFGQ